MDKIHFWISFQIIRGFMKSSKFLKQDLMEIKRLNRCLLKNTIGIFLNHQNN